MQPPPPTPKDPRSQLLCFFFASLFLLLLLFLSLRSPPPPPSPSFPKPPSSFHKLQEPPSPSFAYLLAGSTGDSDRLFRLLHAVYHPRNLYLLHLDAAAPSDERDRLARRAAAMPTFRAARNVHVVGRPDFINPRGSSSLAATLHSAAVLLRLSDKWDWFINLHASDYPLVTQDDLLHVFSFLPRDLNFVQHTSHIGWRESRRYKPIIVDPGLYLSTKVDIFYATQKREMPNAYKLFTGSAAFILSRKFVEYCILGADNLPRSLLMYHANTPSSHVDYFQTVLCNSPQFNRTVVNHDLRYVKWDTSPRWEPQMLSLRDLKNITKAGAAFATRFSKDDSVVDRIDKKILKRGRDSIVPGGWCLGRTGDPCSVWGNADVLKPGSRVKGLSKFIANQLSNGNFHLNQCIWD